MTISTTGNQVTYIGDGASLAFAFPYPFITNADLKVYVNGVLQTTGYSVAGVAPTGGSGTFQNGTVTFGVAPVLSAVVLIYCDPDLTQSTTLPPNDPFPSKTVEKMVDKLTLLIQRLANKFGNAITFPSGDAANGVLPSAALRAGNLVSFDSLGNAQVVAPVAGTATALAVDLASSALSTKNSGQIGFAYGLGYAAGTIGRWLQDLALAAGSTFMGWIQAGTGAVLRTVSSKLREKVSVLDFGADPTGTLSSDAAFAAAIAATTFDGVVEVPDPGGSGFYKLTAGLTIAAVTGSARLVGIGRPTLKFTGLGAAVDGITTTGANYRQSQVENLIIDMSLSGRDGLVLIAGSQPIQKNVTVKNTLRDAFSYQATGFNWIEKLQRTHCTGIAIGRHHTYAMDSGANGGFINEVVDIQPEIRGCAQKVTGGTAIVADSQGTLSGGSQISGWTIIDPIFDCQRAASVANGFDVGVNPILCKYNAAAAFGGQYDSWKIIGGGLETTTGTPVPGVGLVKVEQNASAYGWTIDFGNPGGWPTGGGYVGLRDAVIHDRQTGMFVTRDTGVRAGLKTYVAGVGGPYTVDIPFPILPGFGAAHMNSGTPVTSENNDNGALAMPSQFYSLSIAYQQYVGSGFCYYRSEFVLFYNVDSGNGWGIGSNNVLVNSLGGFITVNSVTIDPANNRVRLSISTTATYGAAGGNLRTAFSLAALGFARDTL